MPSTTFVKRPLTFDETDLDFRGDQNGALLWLTADGDPLELHYFPIPPDIGADVDDVSALRARHRCVANEAGLGVIEIETATVDGCLVVRTLFKIAETPTGRTYVGSLTFPFRDFSYVFRVESSERGTTGLREAFVVSMLLNKGVSIDTRVGQLKGWLDDPYDSNETGPMTRNISERPEYDSRFPDHPLSRARRILNHLQTTVTVDSSIKQQPKFRQFANRPSSY